MPMDPTPDLAALSLADIARMVEEQKLPPVERWKPTHCGDSEMRIARDGTWFHQGVAWAPIFIELKSEKGRVRPEQKEVLQMLDEVGCYTMVCRSLLEVEDFLKRLIKLRC